MDQGKVWSLKDRHDLTSPGSMTEYPYFLMLRRPIRAAVESLITAGFQPSKVMALTFSSDDELRGI